MKSKRSRACDIPCKVKNEVWERDRHRCIYCWSPHASPSAHYISRAKGGLGVPENIVTLCQSCHNAYDNGTGNQQETLGNVIKAYLRLLYSDWDERKLIYSKWR